MFILYCRVIRQWLPTNRQSVGDQLGNDRQPIGDRSATGWQLLLFLIAESLQLFLDRSATDRRLVGDQSATKNCVGIVYNRCNWSAISRQPVGDQSATCRRPPATFLRSIWSQRGFTCSNQNLLATKSSLQPSATCRRLVADLLATTLQPPCDHPKFWLQAGRRPVASYVWPGLYRTWWLCLGPISTTRFTSDLGYRMAKNLIGLYMYKENTFYSSFPQRFRRSFGIACLSYFF